MNTIIKVMLFVLMPLLFGIGIYILFRESSVFYHSKYNSNLNLTFISLPHWFQYNLPDALWALALFNSIGLLFNYKGRNYCFWISISLLISLMFEVSQYFNIIAGTFDMKDIFSIVLVFNLILFINYEKKYS